MVKGSAQEVKLRHRANMYLFRQQILQHSTSQSTSHGQAQNQWSGEVNSTYSSGRDDKYTESVLPGRD